MVSLRFAVVTAVAAACAMPVVASAMPSARAAATGIRFAALPRSVFEGQKPTITVAVTPKNARCTLTMSYPGRRVDRFATQASSGIASWSIRIPAVPQGRARVRAACARAGAVTGSMLVRWAVQSPKITIEKTGYTQRPDTYDTGSSVSWGAAVRNLRLHSDATTVSLLVNFVASDNKVLGSTFANLTRVPQKSLVYVGGLAHLPTKTEVARLEIVVRAKAAPGQPGSAPLISDVVLLPDPHGYLGGIGGQLLNGYPRPLLTAAIGVVIVDSDGDIIGGGVGYGGGPLSFGARVYFTVTGAFSPIPMTRASAAYLSAVPTYATTP